MGNPGTGNGAGGASLANAQVSELQIRLREKDFDGAEWDVHRNLLRAARNTTNGSSGDIRALSENVGLLTAAYVQDRVRESDRLRETFAELHDRICPLTARITRNPDGTQVMPWDRAVGDLEERVAASVAKAAAPAAPAEKGSVFTYGKLTVSGPAAFLAAGAAAVLAVVFLMNWLQSSSLKADLSKVMDAKLESFSAPASLPENRGARREGGEK